MKYTVGLITCGSFKEAKKIASTLLKHKLIACANIIPGITSIYWWKGKIETSKEMLILIKTKKTLIKRIIVETKKVHSYTVPEIITLPLLEGDKPYLEWIKDSTTK